MGMRNALANAALAFEKTLAVVCLKRFNESPQLGLHHAGKRAVDTRHPRKLTDACKVSRLTRQTVPYKPYELYKPYNLLVIARQRRGNLITYKPVNVLRLSLRLLRFSLVMTIGEWFCVFAV